MMPASTPATVRAVGLPDWRGWARRIALFAALWWILTDGVAASWLIGAPIVLLAAWLSRSLWADPPLSMLGVVRFVPYFTYQSLVGAADVARRALQPKMPLYPGLVRHRLRLPPGVARVSLANVVSMLAGTLSADIEGDELVIHALDARSDLHAMVDDLEPRIAAVFNLPLEPAPDGETDR
jgi:multicomponent Na+:H+ antiporter subunit E